MPKRDKYQKKMDEHLALWNQRLETLSSKASVAVQTQFHEELEEWKTAGSAAIARLTELHAASGDSWSVIKLEMDKVWHAIEAALAQAEEERGAQEDRAAANAPAPVPPPPPAEA